MSGIEKSDLLAIHVKSSQVSSKLQVGRTLFMRETIDSNKTDNLMDLKKRKKQTNSNSCNNIDSNKTFVHRK